MTSTPPNVIPDGRYNATETSALLGINRRTLHRWVKERRIKQRFSRTVKHPRYAGKDILALWRSEY